MRVYRRLDRDVQDGLPRRLFLVVLAQDVAADLKPFGLHPEFEFGVDVAVVDIHAVGLFVLEQGLHNFVVFSSGDGLCFARVPVRPETPVLKFAEHLCLQHDGTSAPLQIRAGFFSCHSFPLCEPCPCSTTNATTKPLTEHDRRLPLLSLSRYEYDSFGAGAGRPPPRNKPEKVASGSRTPVSRDAYCPKPQRQMSLAHIIRWGTERGGCPTKRVSPTCAYENEWKWKKTSMADCVN